MSDKIEVENVGQPGKSYRVDAAKYAEMRKAVLTVTPADASDDWTAALAPATLQQQQGSRARIW